MQINIKKRVNQNYADFDYFSKIHKSVIETDDDNIVFNFENCKFMHAGYTAWFGGTIMICDSLGKNVNVQTKENSEIDRYLKKSGLHEYINKLSESYVNKNAIRFKHIENMNGDDLEIMDYIDHILDLAPIELTDKARQTLFTNIYEIFNNACDHSESKLGLFSCGHWMPKKDELVVSIYDAGQGIPKVIRNKIKNIDDNVEALKWSLGPGNSTKQLDDGTPRGIGLSRLLRLIMLNRGALSIISDDVIFMYGNKSNKCCINRFPIKGTLVTINIVADRESLYCLKEE